VSYFSNRVVSIIGAGRLSFRVRDGSGRFPAAVAAVTLFFFQPPMVLFGGGVWSVRFVMDRGCEASVVVLHVVFVEYRKRCPSNSPVSAPRAGGGGVCKFSAG
jgi:hypothetical protein